MLLGALIPVPVPMPDYVLHTRGMTQALSITHVPVPQYLHVPVPQYRCCNTVLNSGFGIKARGFGIKARALIPKPECRALIPMPQRRARMP